MRLRVRESQLTFQLDPGPQIMGRSQGQQGQRKGTSQHAAPKLLALRDPATLGTLHPSS